MAIEKENVDGTRIYVENSIHKRSEHMNQMSEMKFAHKGLQREARKCEKEEKVEKLKVKKAIEKGNVDDARIYAEISIRKRSEHMNQMSEMKFAHKGLQRESRKCEKEEKVEKLKVKKAIEKGNVDDARIYAENSIRKRSEHMNQMSELKFAHKGLQREARKCEKEEKVEKLKVKKVIEKGNVDDTRIYAENSIRKRSEHMNQMSELKFAHKGLQREVRKCEKEEKVEKLKVKKAIEKGNVDDARIYAENSIRKRSEHMNQMSELKFAHKGLQREARKCEKEEKVEKLKVKKVIEKGNVDDARIYVENSIRKRSEHMNQIFVDDLSRCLADVKARS